MGTRERIEEDLRLAARQLGHPGHIAFGVVGADVGPAEKVRGQRRFGRVR